MPAIARHGSPINQSIASGHVPIRRWISTEDGGYYSYSTANATINGTVNKTSGNVYVNGIRAATQNTPTNETETHSIPSGWQAYNQHYSGIGSVTVGNNRNVFVGGVSAAVVGSAVRTHAGNSTTIRNGSPNVFIGG